MFGEPTPVFDDDYEFGGGSGPNGGKLRVVLNWTEELKRILVAGAVR